MFNWIIRFSLNNRLVILAVALGVFLYGIYQARRLPVEVIPDISRPRVTVITECTGMAPEEVETLVTVPLETYLNGANGITSIRSSSTAGLSVITIEFDWNMEPLTCRQNVDERIQQTMEKLPQDIHPQMTPVVSMMAQLMFLTVWDESGELSPMDVRTISDWTVRKQLLEIPGISEILVIGGDVRQYQVQANLADMQRYGLTLADLEAALQQSNRNVTGGFLTKQGPDR